MHKADGRRCRIYDVNRTTVGNVNAERDTAFIRDNAVARGEFAAGRVGALRRPDAVARRPYRTNRGEDYFLRALRALRG